MKHIDLFSGIGGFSLAADRVFGNMEHTFCEIDPFCQEVLKKHWPNSNIYGDIRTITADTDIFGRIHGKPEKLPTKSAHKAQCESFASSNSSSFLLTGGFPCQPFSQAGQRKGTEDDRHLWPEMLRVIRLAKPQWVIAENVRGILTIGGGMVFEQVCTDLEGEGYDVQPFVIPAVALDAPHRRDRVWFVAHYEGGTNRRYNRESKEGQAAKLGKSDGYGNASDTRNTGRRSRSEQCGKNEGADSKRRTGPTRATPQFLGSESGDWSRDWLEVATHLCRMDDGIPGRMDRNPRLKALGNAIVPQIAEEIMRAIDQTI